MSRKKQVNQKITALYCRISLEDGGDNESMSISNQKLMLRDFAEKNGMFQYEYYVDDGYTGRNFNRPSFQRMIADIEAGKIGCVITKDLSRLGRNYIEAGSYIEIFFPKHNVRYIAITDGVDSLTRQEMDITPFKNILNEMFSLRMEAVVIQCSPRIYNKSVSPVLSARPQSAVRLSRFCQSAGEAFPGQGFPDCGTAG